MTSTQEQKILEGIVAGDTDTIKAFYRRNWKPIRSFILAKGGTEQDAEDIFQDALVCLYQRGKSNTLTIHTASIHTFFYAMCKNMWFSCVRRKCIFDTITKQWKIEQIDHQAQELEDQELHQQRRHLFYTYFQQLPTSGKRLMQLVFEGLSIQDIAGKMGYTEGYTRKKKFETKKALLEKLHKDHQYWDLTG